MFVIAVKQGRYSHHLLEEKGEFVINVLTIKLIKQTDFCGRYSGRSVDKFKEVRLTPKPSQVVKAPLIAECPINIECKVVQSVKPGTHTLFVGQVVAAQVEEGAFNGTKLNLEDFPTYLTIGWSIGDTVKSSKRFR